MEPAEEQIGRRGQSVGRPRRSSAESITLRLHDDTCTSGEIRGADVVAAAFTSPQLYSSAILTWVIPMY